ncbi:hypothetical protein [Salsuginibacillus kocurii]|uniref:hypothetical protein n=1 Tax=Salsuginibacillus kocurii TaxID=427078 RepID=UPI0012EAA590|nr:hypothetical protein [Salsuginibacillus kocurii]
MQEKADMKMSPTDCCVTAETAFNERELYKTLKDILTAYENNEASNEEGLHDINEKLSYFRLNADLKEEIETRLNNVQTLRQNLVEIEKAESLRHVRQLKRKIRSFKSTPLKKTAMKQLKEYEEKFSAETLNNNEPAAKQTALITSIPQCNSPEQVAEILIKHLDSNYMNLGKEGRLYVAGLIMQQREQFKSSQDMRDTAYSYCDRLENEVKTINAARSTDEIVKALFKLPLSIFKEADEKIQKGVAKKLLNNSQTYRNLGTLTVTINQIFKRERRKRARFSQQDDVLFLTFDQQERALECGIGRLNHVPESSLYVAPVQKEPTSAITFKEIN